MPVINSNASKNTGTSQPRAIIRPSWVRDGPSPFPMPSSEWTSKIKDVNSSNASKPERPVLEKQTKVTIPTESNSNQSTSSSHNQEKAPVKVETSKSVTQEDKPQSLNSSEPSWKREIKERKQRTQALYKNQNLKSEPNPKNEQNSKEQQNLKSEPIPKKEQKLKSEPILKKEQNLKSESNSKEQQNLKSGPIPKKEQNLKSESSSKKQQNLISEPNPEKEQKLKSALNPKKEQNLKSEQKMPPTASKPPPAPPAMTKTPPPPPPMAPPPPPMDSAVPVPLEKKALTKGQADKLEMLRSRPRRRPDWSDMMKEVESGKKLKHVQCNDRSAPIIPKEKTKGQFVYESETKDDSNDRNKLLKQIQSGIRLKKVKTNDRSKPNIDGLRKFKREMTIEEQIKKCVSMADVVAAAVEPDELDDIDKVRDDLQSAKQMLALELRNKEAIERENKRLLTRLTNLETELEKEKSSRTAETTKGQPVQTEEDKQLIIKLKEDAAEADRIAKDMEHKYHTTAEQLDNMRRKLESAWLRNQELEQQLKSVSQGTPVNQLMRQPSKKFIPIANGGSVDLISDDEEEESETETEEESDTENVATQEKQMARELKLLTTKLKTFEEKKSASIKERKILKEQLKKKQNELKEEKKKYKVLHKEVDKMAKLMKEHEEENGEEERHEEVEEEETESESESEESEEEEEVASDEELPNDASSEEKRKFLLERTKRHENRLSSLKKGNNLMKANIERLIDDVNNQREMSLTLQEDLNNILADFG